MSPPRMSVATKLWVTGGGWSCDFCPVTGVVTSVLRGLLKEKEERKGDPRKAGQCCFTPKSTRYWCLLSADNLSQSTGPASVLTSALVGAPREVHKKHATLTFVPTFGAQLRTFSPKTDPCLPSLISFKGITGISKCENRL